MSDDIDTKQSGTSLRTLERGLDVLDCFRHDSARLSLTEISAKIGLNPSTTFRILATLEGRNYIKRDSETKKYQLGSQILYLLSPSLEAFDLRPIALPYMQQLHDIYNESVTLYVMLDGYRVCLDRIETTHGLRRVINIGDRLPLTRGAGGKVLLAWLPEHQRNKLWSADPAIPLEQLEQVRQEGFACSISEREEGVAAIAAPIFDATGQVIAALSIAVPTVRITPEAIQAMIPDVVKTAENISLALGWKKGDQ